MTKLEFMSKLASELHKRNIADAADVLADLSRRGFAVRQGNLVHASGHDPAPELIFAG